MIRHFVMEGPDGVGKSSTMQLLKQHPFLSGLEIHNYANPGATLLGQEIRKIVKYRKDITLDPFCEQLLMCVDCCHYFNQVVKPAESAGGFVFSDRMNAVSATAYGLANGINPAQLLEIHRVIRACNPNPFAVFVFQAPFDVIVGRQHHDTIVENGVTRQVECKIQARGQAFHQRVCDIYERIINATLDREVQDSLNLLVGPELIYRVDAARPQREVVEEIAGRINQLRS